MRYRVVIEAPAPLRDTLAASVDLIRWQGYDEMTASLFDALVRRASDQAKEAAATEGFFSASVDVAVDRTTAPFTVTVRVTPGVQARVSAATVAVEGAAATDAGGSEAISKVKREWPLPAGALFRQSAWTDAKTQAVDTLAGSAFAAAKLVSSEASVDPDANSVDLEIAIDSGPVFHVGELDIEGLSALHGGSRAELPHGQAG